MEPDQARVFVNEELRTMREALDRVGAMVEDLVVALEEREAEGQQVAGGGPSVSRAHDERHEHGTAAG